MNTEKNGHMRIMTDLFLTFFKIGAVTFGGGLAMLPILEQELAEKRKWTTKEQLLDYFAIGQSTPGIIAVNVATFLGYNHAGIAGGIVATLGVIAPSILIITVLALFLSGFNDIVWVQKALAGINVAVAALLCKIVIGFGKKIVSSAVSFILCAASFAAITVFNINTVFVILGAIAVGVAVYAFRLHRNPPAPEATAGEHPEERRPDGSAKHDTGHTDKEESQ